MFFWLASLLLMLSVATAEVGKVSKVIGTGDAYILRNSEKLATTVDLLLEQGDEIFTQDSVVVVHLYPQSQMSLSKNTHVKLTQSVIEETTETEKAFSVIEFVKGIIRLQVTKEANQEIDQKVQADGVAFAVRGTEFEVSSEGDDFDLDVVEGSVEVSSPFVQTFVPEVVKANQGFRFNKKHRKFERRQFRMKLKNAGFVSRSELREKWKEQRQQRRLNKVDKKQHRREKKERKKNK